MGSTLKSRRLFLRWSLVNALAVVFFGALTLHGFFSDLHGAPALAAGAVAVFTIATSAYAGLLSWQLDDIFDEGPLLTEERGEFNHKLTHVFHAIWVAQILGIIGALVGYREQTKAAAEASGDASAAVREVFSALGNGLIATMLGVLCSLLFFIEYRMIEHALGRDE